MQNARGVRGRESVGDAQQQGDNLPPGAFLRPRPTGERATVDKFGNQVLAAFKIAGVVNGENVRMVERGSHLRLALEAAARGRIGQTRRTGI